MLNTDDTSDLTVTTPSGQEATYRLKFAFSAMKALEKRLSTPDRKVRFLQVLAAVSQGGMTELGQVLWCALQKHHAKQFPDFDSVDWLLDDHMTVIGQAMADLTETTKPDPEDQAELAPNPPVAQDDRSAPRATGETLKSTVVASA